MPQLIVTEVTEIGNSFCVAAWDPQNKTMIRPMPNQNYWAAELVQQINLAQGTEFTCTYLGRDWRSHPHRTEDTNVDPSSIAVVSQNFWVNHKDRPQEHSSIDQLFGGKEEIQSSWNRARKIFVPENTVCPSLGGVRVSARTVKFVEESYNGAPPKLRAHIRAGLLVKDNLSVTCVKLRKEWASSGLDALNKLIRDTESLHLRVGLARPFDGMPQKCSVQLNGIIF